MRAAQPGGCATPVSTPRWLATERWARAVIDLAQERSNAFMYDPSGCAGWELPLERRAATLSRACTEQGEEAQRMSIRGRHRADQDSVAELEEADFEHPAS
jgi:hypothetical protein